MSESEDGDGYLEIDALSNALDYLKKATDALGDTGDPFRWKWAVLGIASGLYGLLICALEGSNNANVMDFGRMSKPDREECRRLHEAGDTDSYMKARDIEERFLSSRAAKLLSFEDCMKRARKNEYMELSTLPTSKPLELSEKQFQNILRLWSLFRNSFEHFVPRSWYIEQAYFGPLLSDALVAVEQLSDNANLWMAYDGDRVEELKQFVPELRKALDANTLPPSSLRRQGPRQSRPGTDT